MGPGREERRGGPEGVDESITRAESRAPSPFTPKDHPQLQLQPRWEVLGGTGDDPYVPTERAKAILFVSQLTNLHLYINGYLFLNLIITFQTS